MNRMPSEQDAYELDYACSFRPLKSRVECRELNGTEKRNRAARYGRGPARQSSATKGIHRRGGRRQAA